MDDDAFEKLALAVLRRATADAAAGSQTASEWLMGADCEWLLESLGLDVAAFRQRLNVGPIDSQGVYVKIEGRTDERD